MASEDIEFMDSPEEYEEIPKFGTSKSDYESTVGPFYAYWQSYCTKKTYTWLCPHNINEIRDRRILREIEKETKKLAQKARKKRNEEIRTLVSFVRKRDKRVQAHTKKLEERAEQNRIKQQQHRLAQLRKNQQDAEEMRKTQSNTFNTSDHEERLRQMEQAYGSDSSEYDDYNVEDDDIDRKDENVDSTENGITATAEEYYMDDLYCVACNKSFKNASSYENHESSKKHRDNIERLKEVMQQEEEEEKEEDEEQIDSNDEHSIDDDNDLEAELTESDGADILLESQSNSKSCKKSKKSKKSKNKIQIVHPTSDNEHDSDEIEKPLADISIGNNADDDKNNWSDDGGKKGKKSKNKKSTKSASNSKASESIIETECNTNENELDNLNKKSNKKSKKSSNRAEAKESNADGTSSDVSHSCVTCNSTFDSKNKLFAHLKKTNHGVYIPKSSGTPATTTNESKRNKRK